MIFPIASFTCKFPPFFLFPYYVSLNHLSIITFTDKFAFFIHDAKFLSNLQVDRRVLLKIIKAQMLCEFRQLFFTQSLIEKFSHFFNLSSQILIFFFQIKKLRPG